MSSPTEQKPEKILGSCENCGSTEQHLFIHSKNNHATWSSQVKEKKIFVECPQCKRILELEQEPAAAANSELPVDEEETVSEELAPSARLRYFSYLGIAFLILLVLWGIMSTLQEDRDVQNYLLKPTGNVLFISEISRHEYKTGKIDSVANGVLHLRFNTQIYKKFVEADQNLQQLKDNYQADPQQNLENVLINQDQIPLNQINSLQLKRIIPLSN